MYKTVDIAALFVRRHCLEGDICIDATCGNGNDAVFLSELTGPCGLVYAFDIQRTALTRAKETASEKGLGNIRFIEKSHIHMDEYVEDNTAGCIMFNLGWLPGGDHNIRTTPEDTILALEKSLKLIRKNGIISLCLYCGKEMGYGEKEAVLSFSKELGREYEVIYMDYLNKTDPPTNLFIIKS